MTRRECLRVSVLPAVAFCAFAANGPDLSGTWNLNVDKSSWGRKPRPHSVVIRIEHKEPSLRYSGVVTADNEGAGRPFEFAGAIDGKGYPYRDGKIIIRRVDSHTTTSTYTSADGSVTETATTSLSRDGRTLTRRIEAKAPEGRSRWTEVYERQ